MAEDAKKFADDSVEQKGRADDQLNQPKDDVAEVDDDSTTRETTTSTNASLGDEIKDADIVEDSSKSNVDEKTSESSNSESKTDNNEDSDEPKKDTDDAASISDEDDGKGKSENKDETDDEEKDKANIAISIEIPEDKKSKDSNTDAFQESVREQIENCKFEIISSIQESLHDELRDYTVKQIKKIERRRKAGVIIRDIVILILAALVGYFGYCLYDAKYFGFMKSDCEQQNNCDSTNSDVIVNPEPEVVKDTAWYQNNYGYLFDSLKINLNADNVSAYYLYSDDYKVSEIKPSYLLAMAYNRLNSNITYDSDKGIMVPANDLKTSFANLFGSADLFARQGFTYDCAVFEYDSDTDSFITPSMQCNSSSRRKIVEDIDEIYEEGNAMYFLTTAAIFDTVEESFYSFDNLFKPAVKNTSRDELAKYKSMLNQYQYRFKKVDGNYYFSDIVKLK